MRNRTPRGLSPVIDVTAVVTEPDGISVTVLDRHGHAAPWVPAPTPGWFSTPSGGPRACMAKRPHVDPDTPRTRPGRRPL